MKLAHVILCEDLKPFLIRIVGNRRVSLILCGWGRLMEQLIILQFIEFRKKNGLCTALMENKEVIRLR